MKLCKKEEIVAKFNIKFSGDRRARIVAFDSWKRASVKSIAFPFRSLVY